MANQDIQLRSPGTNAWDVSLSTPEGIVLPQQTIGWIKVQGQWRRASLLKKVGNDWKMAKAHVKIAGEWA